jgi:hypothetical protein
MLATYISLLAPKNKNVTTTGNLRRYRWMCKETIRKCNCFPSAEMAQVERFGYLTTTAEIRVSLTEKMYANFKTISDYDSTPAQG